MAFWGVEVKPGRPFKLLPKGRLHVSQAVLGIGAAMNKCFVQCSVGNKSGSVFLCCLVPNICESSQLNLEFEEVDAVLFSVVGSRSIHITGFYLNSSSYSSQDKSEESYGVNIENSESEDRFEDDEEYEDDSFINDDVEVVPDSPCWSDDVKDDVEEEKRIRKDDIIGKRKRVYADESESEEANVKNYIAKKVVVSDSESDDDKTVNAFFMSSSNLLGGNKKQSSSAPNISSMEPGVDATTKIKGKHILDPQEEEKFCNNNNASAVEEESSKKKKKVGDGSSDYMIYNNTTRADGKEQVALWSTTLPNGLLIEDIHVGNPHEKLAILGTKVSVHFTCKIKGNEQVVNSSLDGKPLKFQLGGLEEIMSGWWNDGIVGMRVGGKRRLTIPPSLWKGKGHECKKIRSKTSLVYEIHLLRVRG